MINSNNQYSESCVPCKSLETLLSKPLETYLAKPGETPLYSTNPTPGDDNFNDIKFENGVKTNVWDTLRSPEYLARMCHSDPNIYVPPQYGANPYKNHRAVEWNSYLTVNI